MPRQRQDAQDRDRHACLGTELPEDMLQVLLHRPGTHAEHKSDLVMTLALGYPAEHLGLSRGEAQEPAQHLVSQHQGTRSPLLPASRFLRITTIFLGQRLG